MATDPLAPPEPAPPPRIRGRTISIKRLSKRELERGRAENPADPGTRPRPSTRGGCLQGEDAARPCPYVSCRHHLYLDVAMGSGAIKLNFPHLEVWEMAESCTLDVADRGGITLEEVGVIMNLTRERIRQLETRGLAKLKALNEMAALQDYADDAPAENWVRAYTHTPANSSTASGHLSRIRDGFGSTLPRDRRGSR